MRWSLTLVGSLIGLSGQAFAAPDGNPPGTGWTPDQNVLGYVEQSDQLTQFLALLKLSEMTSLLKGSAPITLLAPTDKAFAGMPQDMVRDLKLPKNRSQLKSILGCHIIAGRITFDSLEQASVGNRPLHLTSITGCKLTVRLEGDHIAVDDENGIKAALVYVDVKEANGIVQVVDGVLTPSVPKTDECAKASSQADLDVCADKAFRKSDAELNGLYKSVVQRLKDDSATVKLLVDAQRAWVAFRDSECAFSASGVGTGSAYPMIVAQCRQALTDRRNDELQRYLKCEEGDMSCPVPTQ